jgi:hypothetical protein
MLFIGNLLIVVIDFSPLPRFLNQRIDFAPHRIRAENGSAHFRAEGKLIIQFHQTPFLKLDLIELKLKFYFILGRLPGTGQVNREATERRCDHDKQISSRQNHEK